MDSRKRVIYFCFPDWHLILFPPGKQNGFIYGVATHPQKPRGMSWRWGRGHLIRGVVGETTPCDLHKWPGVGIL